MNTNGKPCRKFLSGLFFSWLLFFPPFSAIAAPENPSIKNKGHAVDSTAFGQPENQGNWVRIDGEDIIDAPIHIVALFFKDVKKSIRMTPGLRNKVVLKQISDTERIDYDHFKLPWPFKDRYLIYHAKQEYDSGQEILFILNSITNYPYEDKDKILGIVHASSFRLRSLGENPARTRITVSMRINPNGWLPVWLLNLHTQKWADELFRNLQEDIQKYLADPSD